MSIVSWGNSLAIGVDAIDAQHKQLIDIINRLHDLILSAMKPISRKTWSASFRPMPCTIFRKKKP